MADAPINEVLNNALKDAIDSWKQEGLSDEEILAKIDKIDFKDVMMSITDTAATDRAEQFSLAFDPQKPIHILCGRDPVLPIMLIASFTGDYSAFDEYPCATLHTEVTLGQKDYRLCVLHTDGEMLLAANFDTDGRNPNVQETKAYVRYIEGIDRPENNLFFGKRIRSTPIPHGQSTRLLSAFEQWLTEREKDPHGSQKPLYILDLLDYLDQSTDLSPLFARLGSLNRQVFLCAFDYQNIRHPMAEIISIR